MRYTGHWSEVQHQGRVTRVKMPKRTFHDWLLNKEGVFVDLSALGPPRIVQIFGSRGAWGTPDQMALRH